MAKPNAWMALVGLAALGVASRREGTPVPVADEGSGLGAGALARGAAGLRGLATRAPWLIDGRVSVVSGYGPRGGRWHNGADLAAAKLAVVHAPARGVVHAVYEGLYKNDGSPWYTGGGRVVILRHAAADTPAGAGVIETRYLHLTDTAVTRGQVVTPGQPIGRVGETRCIALAGPGQTVASVLAGYGLDRSDPATWEAIVRARATWEESADLVPDQAVAELRTALPTLRESDARLLVGVFEQTRNSHAHVEVHRVGAPTLPDASGRPGDSLDPVAFFSAWGVPLGERVTT